MKRIFRACLFLLMLLIATPLANLVGLELVIKAQAYDVGDTILFGTYPQQRIEETPELQAAAEAATWKSYGYYDGGGNTEPSDYMQFADFFVGNEKYRAVTFSSYRPPLTGINIPLQIHLDNQSNNGYTSNTVYYFKYEPLTWRILDPSTGYIMCESIIDSQAYQNTTYYSNSEYWQTIGSSVYANDYAASSIREWLNYDFYETAFTEQQKNNIEMPTTLLDNSCRNADSEYSYSGTYDKIYLISYSDATNPAYGFKAEPSNVDATLSAQGTDYAQCQGLNVYRSSESTSNGNSIWWMRTPNDGFGTNKSGLACVVLEDGHASSSGYVCAAYFGVRPVCSVVNLQDDIFQSESLFSAGIHTHIPGETVIENEKAATCAAVGSYDEVVYCTECGAELSRIIKTAGKIAHTLKFVSVTKATEDGYTGDATCSVCNETVKIGNSMPTEGADDFQLWDESKDTVTAMYFDGDFGTVGTGAFSDFPNLAYVIFNTPFVTLASESFSNCPKLETALFFGNAVVDASSFDTAEALVQIYYPASASFSFAPTDPRFHMIPFSFADRMLQFNGAVTWDGYQLLDTMTAFCLHFDPIHVLKCSDLTFDALPLYGTTKDGDYERIEGNRLSDAEIRLQIDETDEISYNELVQGIADGSITNFRLVAKDSAHEEIKDTPVEIKEEDDSGIGGFIRKAIKWVVRIIDAFLNIISKLRR